MPKDQRRTFWDQAAADAGDNPYFPEFVSPHSSSEWRRIYTPGYWYVYILNTDRIRRHPVYVGMTGNILNRLSQHRRTKAWWPLVDRIIVDRCDSQVDALELEEQFIYRMKPLFNVVSNQHTVEVT